MVDGYFQIELTIDWPKAEVTVCDRLDELNRIKLQFIQSLNDADRFKNILHKKDYAKKTSAFLTPQEPSSFVSVFQGFSHVRYDHDVHLLFPYFRHVF